MLLRYGDRSLLNADVFQLEAQRKRRRRRHDFLVNHDDYAIFVRASAPKETVVSRNWFKEGQIIRPSSWTISAEFFEKLVPLEIPLLCD